MLIEFDNPVSVMHSDLWDYAQTHLVDGYFEPPISFSGLAKSLRANAVHSSAIYAKRNILAASLTIDTDLISREHLLRYIFDKQVFGNGYLLRIKNGLGKVIKLKHLPALYMRRREKENCFSYKTTFEEIKYKEGSVFHWMEYDVTQEIYGVPQYFAALSAIWLNEDATLFRRKYYLNGAHSGFLLYMNNPNLSEDQEKDIKEKLNSTKGLGNFRNMFINGKGKDGEKPELIPVGQINTKDEFFNIKKVTTEDILSVHRIPLDLMSVVRDGLTSGGDLNKVDRIFYKNEILPLATELLEINNFSNSKVIEIIKYDGLDDKKDDKS